MTPMEILNAYKWEHYDLSSPQDGFNRPGVVLVCRPQATVTPGERRYTPLSAINAKNDAGAIATSAIKQARDPLGEVYALIFLSDDAGLRARIQAQLETLCSGGK